MNKEQLRLKQYESLVIYQAGGEKIVLRNNFEETVNTDSIYGDYRESQNRRQFSSRVALRVDLTLKDVVGGTNNAGLRILDCYSSYGVVPPSLVSINTIKENFPNCFIPGTGENICLAAAILENVNQMSSNFELDQSFVITMPDEESEKVKNCKFVYHKLYCLIPNPGYISTIQIWQRGPFLYSAIPIEEFDNSGQFEKDFYVKFESNSGKFYLLDCPHLCKIYF